MAEQNQSRTDLVLPELESGVYENANTIAKWLLSQPEETQPQ